MITSHNITKNVLPVAIVDSAALQLHYIVLCCTVQGSRRTLSSRYCRTHATNNITTTPKHGVHMTTTPVAGAAHENLRYNGNALTLQNIHYWFSSLETSITTRPAVVVRLQLLSCTGRMINSSAPLAAGKMVGTRHWLSLPIVRCGLQYTPSSIGACAVYFEEYTSSICNAHAINRGSRDQGVRSRCIICTKTL